MGIQIKKQEDRIKELHQQILQLIYEMKRNNSRDRISEVQNLQIEYWKLTMQRDIPDIPVTKRNEILKYMTEFVPLGSSNQYFSRDNILDVLEQLTNGISMFKEIPENERGDTYGIWDGFILSVNRDNDSNMQRNTIFHELAHCVTRPQIEKDDTTIPQSGVKIVSGVYKPKDTIQREKHKSGKITITRNDEPMMDLDKLTSISGWRFISEVIAEEMAQTLYYDNNSRPSKSQTGSLLHNILPLESNWMTPFNRHYQQFGEEFAQNLYAEDGTSALKKLTLLALNKNADFQQEVAKMYGGSREEFENALKCMGVIKCTVEAFGRVDYEQLNRILINGNELLKRHNKTNRLKIKAGIQKEMTQATVHYGEDEPPQSTCSRVTPQEIVETTRHTIRINPGQVSKGVRIARGIKMRNRTDKDDHTRN